jgi:cytochrome P450
MDMYLGHATTAHTLSWFVYSLTKHHDVQERVTKEMKTAYRESKGIALSSELPAYVEAVLKESMRRYPVATFGSFRQVKDEAGYLIEDGEKSYTIPKGAWIVVNAHVLHNWEENWGSNASDFIPERWLDSQTSTKLESNPLSSLAIYGGGGISKGELMFAPFSYGPRNCLGMNLALLESKMLISELVGKFSFKFASLTLDDESKARESYFICRPLDKLPVLVYTTAGSGSIELMSLDH